MRGFGVEDNRPMFGRVLAAYSDTHRSYHTVSHIDACLAQFDMCHGLACWPHEVEVALWFHDVVYWPRASDNERQSADLACEFLRSAGVCEVSVTRVEAHIMSTVHAVEPVDPDSQLVVDIDLSVLGQDVALYRVFERCVREEYKWVPWFVYRRKRAAVLQSFLERAHIYSTPLFRERYEEAARANLRRAIEGLTN